MGSDQFLNSLICDIFGEFVEFLLFLHWKKKAIIIDNLYKLDVKLIGILWLDDQGRNERGVHLQTKSCSAGRQGWAVSNVGVGKTSIIQTYLQGQVPKLLPPNDDITFYTKKEWYDSNNFIKTKAEKRKNMETLEAESSPVY
jgi:hypothetical protein